MNISELMREIDDLAVIYQEVIESADCTNVLVPVRNATTCRSETLPLKT